jgi:hypothetical protein
MANYTYVLFLTIDFQGKHADEIIFLGSSAEPDLYYKTVYKRYKVKPIIVSEKTRIIAIWKNLVKAELNAFEEGELDNAFMKCENYSYTLKNMTLHLEKVQSFDSYYKCI